MPIGRQPREQRQRTDLLADGVESGNNRGAVDPGKSQPVRREPFGGRRGVVRERRCASKLCRSSQSLLGIDNGLHPGHCRIHGTPLTRRQRCSAFSVSNQARLTDPAPTHRAMSSG